MKLLTKEAIFDEYVVQHLDKFMMAFNANIKYKFDIPYDLKVDMFKIYYNHDCKFSFYYFLDLASFLNDQNYLELKTLVLELIVTYFSDFNYCLVTDSEEGYYLYVSENNSSTKVYLFENKEEYSKFIQDNVEGMITYEIC